MQTSTEIVKLAKQVMRQAIRTKQAQVLRRQSQTAVIQHLDKVAACLPLEKQAAVRVMQGALAKDQDLSVAIKQAYPHLNGERRGILASQMIELTRKALQKKASSHENQPAIFNGSYEDGKKHLSRVFSEMAPTSR